jgi:hypothetical protein
MSNVQHATPGVTHIVSRGKVMYDIFSSVSRLRCVSVVSPVPKLFHKRTSEKLAQTSALFHRFGYLSLKRHKVNESRNRPGVAQRVPGGLDSHISTTFSTLRWWGCQPHAPAAFIPRKCSWYSYSLGAASTPGPWCGRKEYVTEKSSDTPGIDPGTVQLVAQRLNHYATPGP